MTEEITAYCIRCRENHPLIVFEGAPLDEHEMEEEYPYIRADNTTEEIDQW